MKRLARITIFTAIATLAVACAGPTSSTSSRGGGTTSGGGGSTPPSSPPLSPTKTTQT